MDNWENDALSKLALKPESGILDFGQVLVNNPSMQTLSIENVGQTMVQLR